MTAKGYIRDADGPAVDMRNRLPIGEKFLPGTTAKRLGKLARESDGVKTSRKYHAAMHRKLGKSISEIATLLGEKCEVVRGWLAGIHEGGAAPIPRRKSPGAPRKMPPNIHLRIAEVVQKGPHAVNYPAEYWTLESLWMYGRDRLGLDISYSTAVQNFGDMGLAVHIQRPDHPRAASAKERAAAQSKGRNGVRASTGKGDRAVSVDEGHGQGNENGNAAGDLKGVHSTRPMRAGRANDTLFVEAGNGHVITRYAPAVPGEYIKFRDTCRKIRAIADRPAATSRTGQRPTSQGAPTATRRRR